MNITWKNIQCAVRPLGSAQTCELPKLPIAGDPWTFCFITSVSLLQLSLRHEELTWENYYSACFKTISAADAQLHPAPSAHRASDLKVQRPEFFPRLRRVQLAAHPCSICPSFQALVPVSSHPSLRASVSPPPSMHCCGISLNMPSVFLSCSTTVRDLICFTNSPRPLQGQLPGILVPRPSQGLLVPSDSIQNCEE